ncbi:MAG: class I SAM-dependent methyltransferase [Bacteroidota bacterium]|nr:class I SAM-dependent methyltransferase [Bacteroidota bacterium]
MEAKTNISLSFTTCCVCGSGNAKQIGIGEDFEYHTSADKFVAMRCNSCSLVYLNPRPLTSEFSKIYPSNYHAFDFSKKKYGFAYKMRSRLEASRFIKRCRNLPLEARILDVGCGDGFHLDLFRRFGKKSWKVEGIDIDKRAVVAARGLGFNVHLGTVEEIDLPGNGYDLIFMIQTIEHVEWPDKALAEIYRLLKKNGRLVIITDNTDSIDFELFKGSYWGGYHFPRHLNLFNKHSLSMLGEKSGFEIEHIRTIVSPVNWVYSIHNLLVGWKAPRWFISGFTLRSTISLSIFTGLDFILQKMGKGALLEATLRKPY